MKLAWRNNILSMEKIKKTENCRNDGILRKLISEKVMALKANKWVL